MLGGYTLLGCTDDTDSTSKPDRAQDSPRPSATPSADGGASKPDSKLDGGTKDAMALDGGPGPGDPGSPDGPGNPGNP